MRGQYIIPKCCNVRVFCTAGFCPTQVYESSVQEPKALPNLGICTGSVYLPCWALLMRCPSFVRILGIFGGLLLHAFIHLCNEQATVAHTQRKLTCSEEGASVAHLRSLEHVAKINCIKLRNIQHLKDSKFPLCKSKSGIGSPQSHHRPPFDLLPPSLPIHLSFNFLSDPTSRE